MLPKVTVSRSDSATLCSTWENKQEELVSYLTLQFIQQLLQPVDLRAPVLSVFHVHTWTHDTTTTLKSSQSPKQNQPCVLIQLRMLFLIGSEWSVEYTTQSFLSVYDHWINGWRPQLVVSKQMAPKHREECRSGFNAPSENPLLWRTHGEKNAKESKMKIRIRLFSCVHLTPDTDAGHFLLKVIFSEPRF